MSWNIFLLAWYWQNFDGQQEQIHKSVTRGAAIIKDGDVVRIGQDLVPRHRWRLGIVIKITKSNDLLVRGAKVKFDKTRNAIVDKSRNVKLIVCIQLNTEYT